MIVIDSCNTVASETQTKYGIWGPESPSGNGGQIATANQMIVLRTITMSTAASVIPITENFRAS